MTSNGQEQTMLRNNEPAATLGDAPPRAAIAQDYVHARHPETGLDVVFVPGEALPAWLATQLEDETEPAPPPKGHRPVKSP